MFRHTKPIKLNANFRESYLITSHQSTKIDMKTQIFLQNPSSANQKQASLRFTGKTKYKHVGLQIDTLK